MVGTRFFLVFSKVKFVFLWIVLNIHCIISRKLETFVLAVEFRFESTPAISICWDQVGAVSCVLVVEIKILINYIALAAYSHTDPARKLFNLKSNTSFLFGSCINRRFDDYKSLSGAVSPCLFSKKIVHDLDLCSLQSLAKFVDGVLLDN